MSGEDAREWFFGTPQDTRTSRSSTSSVCTVPTRMSRISTEFQNRSCRPALRRVLRAALCHRRQLRRAALALGLHQVAHEPASDETGFCVPFLTRNSVSFPFVSHVDFVDSSNESRGPWLSRTTLDRPKPETVYSHSQNPLSKRRRLRATAGCESRRVARSASANSATGTKRPRAETPCSHPIATCGCVGRGFSYFF